jgi:hypothetical protein
VRDPDTECWMWIGSADALGYGKLWRDGQPVMAHRAAYEMIVGEIPEGLVIDHLCRTPPCVNPRHLEPVTRRENTLRGTNPAAVNARRTECVNGHEFTPTSTWWRSPTRRVCRPCKNSRARAYRAGDAA